MWDQPAALRLQKPGWRDPRLIVGLVLLALGIGLGSAVVNSASNTVGVFTATSALPAGTPLSADAVRIEQVRVPNLAATYLNPELADDTWWLEQRVLVRAVGPGEMIPLAALATTTDQQLRPVTLSVPAGTEQGLSAGTIVDLWHVSETNSTEPPREIVTDLEVSAVTEETGQLSLSGGVAVTVLVPVADLQNVLDAKSSSGSIEVVRHLQGGR